MIPPFEEIDIKSLLPQQPPFVMVDALLDYSEEKTVQLLMQQTAAPDRKTDPLGWTQWMNALKAQAEELAMKRIYSL